MHPQIIDANVSRVTEGLRVLEEYARFVLNDTILTKRLAEFRRTVNSGAREGRDRQILARDTTKDARARELPTQRKNLRDLLGANAQRVVEALRVLEEYTGNSRYTELRYDMYDLEKELFLRLPKPVGRGIYLLSDSVAILVRGMAWGVALVQLRDKTSSKHVVLEKARRVQEKATAAGIPFIVNDDIEIALAVDADGFHSGQDGLSVTEQRKILGPTKIIGKSSHTLAQGLTAQGQGADYVSVGPLFATPSKPERAAIGFDYLRQAKERLTIPYVVIGGVTLKRMEEIMQYDPPLVALIRDYQNVPIMIKKYFS